MDRLPTYQRKTIEDVRHEIENFRAEVPPLSWEKIGIHYGLSGMHIWKIANQSYEPVRADIRTALGLSEMVHVIHMGGEVIPSGSQVLTVSTCACGRHFISNHPRRLHCFVCSPYRKSRI